MILERAREMASTSEAILAVGDAQLDLAAGELRRNGVVVEVEPQVFALIAHLAARPGALVSRDELIVAVWGGRIVSDSAIATRINAARAALGDDGKAQRVIQTLPRRGFRFVGENNPAPELSLPDKPSIAVLPFNNMSGDPEQEFFSDGITDDIITELARYDELFVIARHSSFAYKGRTIDLREIARELGVQYVLEGGVRRSGGRVRVTAQLIDTTNGNHVWAERYDRELEDIFAVQDEITALIVNTLVGKVIQKSCRAGREGPARGDRRLRSSPARHAAVPDHRPRRQRARPARSGVGHRSRSGHGSRARLQELCAWRQRHTALGRRPAGRARRRALGRGTGGEL